MPLHVVVSLWTTYVEASALWGSAVHKLRPSDFAALDRMQRVAGRMLLGFAKRSPAAAVCMELGWSLWSSSFRTSRLCLLRRLSNSSNSITQDLLALDVLVEGSWSQIATQDLHLWSGGASPTSDCQWQRVFSASVMELAADDAEELWLACQRHPQLHHYRPEPWCMEGRPAINAFLHVRSQPSSLGRQLALWLCGGQGLRGGDTNQHSGCSLRTACLPCLALGRRHRETLHHVLHVCPLYSDIRSDPEIAHVCSASAFADGICLHRDCWSWHNLRAVRRLLTALHSARRSFMLRSMPKRSTLFNRRVVEWWDAST